jgi:hypothetical protein
VLEAVRRRQRREVLESWRRCKDVEAVSADLYLHANVVERRLEELIVKARIRRAKKKLEKCDEHNLSRRLYLALQVARFESQAKMEADGVHPKLRSLLLKHRYCQDTIAVAEAKLVELDSYEVGSSGQRLGQVVTTPCELVEDVTERRKRRKAVMGPRPVKPKGYVCHRCDVPECVAADHLFWGSATDNMRDCILKGRHWKQGGVPLDAVSKRSRLNERIAELRSRATELMESISSLDFSKG